MEKGLTRYLSILKIPSLMCGQEYDKTVTLFIRLTMGILIWYVNKDTNIALMIIVFTDESNRL